MILPIHEPREITPPLMHHNWYHHAPKKKSSTALQQSAVGSKGLYTPHIHAFFIPHTLHSPSFNTNIHPVKSSKKMQLLGECEIVKNEIVITACIKSINTLKSIE